MFVALQETIRENTTPAGNELTELLTGLGFAPEVSDVELELAIDQFDQWTNSADAALYPSSCGWYDTGVELERAA